MSLISFGYYSGPKWNQKTILMQNFWGKQAGLLGEMGKWWFHPFCANPRAFTRTRRIEGACSWHSVSSESNTPAKIQKEVVQVLRFRKNWSQSSLYRSWKTWKVMEFKNFIFQACKVLEFLKLSVLEIHGKLKFCLVV